MTIPENEEEIYFLANSREYWQKLCPWMHLEDMDLIDSVLPMDFDQKDLRRWRLLFLKEGYFELPPMPEILEVDNLRRAVTTLVQEGWMSPYGFMYDEFWLLFARLEKLINFLMGEDCYRLPDFWIWHIDPRSEESGFAIHRDKGRMSLFEDGTPKSLTIWVSLGHSTTLNGCMYIVPAHRDPTYNTEDEYHFRFSMQDVRALPAAPGTVFGWDQAVIHWGSHASRRATEPRVSVAVEFQRADVPPFNQPLQRVYELPVFSARLKLLAKQVLQYQHLYRLSPRVQAVAERFMADWAGQAQQPRKTYQ